MFGASSDARAKVFDINYMGIQVIRTEVQEPVLASKFMLLPIDKFGPRMVGRGVLGLRVVGCSPGILSLIHDL